MTFDYATCELPFYKASLANCLTSGSGPSRRPHDIGYRMKSALRLPRGGTTVYSDAPSACCGPDRMLEVELKSASCAAKARLYAGRSAAREI